MAELNSFVDYFREKYGARMQKVVVDAGFTCPNRDGTKGTGGCSFCLNNAFHPNYSLGNKKKKKLVKIPRVLKTPVCSACEGQ